MDAVVPAEAIPDESGTASAAATGLAPTVDEAASSSNNNNNQTVSTSTTRTAKRGRREVQALETTWMVDSSRGRQSQQGPASSSSSYAEESCNSNNGVVGKRPRRTNNNNNVLGQQPPQNGGEIASGGGTTTTTSSAPTNDEQQEGERRTHDCQQSQQQQGRWKAHQLAEDYVEMASQLVLHNMGQLGPYGVDPKRASYPLDAVSVLRYLQSPLRRPTVLEQWSPIEIAVFEAAIAEYGKEFHLIQRAIVSSLSNTNSNKTTRDVIDFYYVWKKTKHYQKWKKQYVPPYLDVSDDDDGDNNGPDAKKASTASKDNGKGKPTTSSSTSRQK